MAYSYGIECREVTVTVFAADSTFGAPQGKLPDMAREWVDRWLGRGANIATVWTLIPSGIVGVITAILSQGVQWIKAYGAFGWWIAGLSGFFLSAVTLALAGVAWQRFAMARAAQKWSRDVDVVNPLAAEFHGQRIKLADLAHPITGRIQNKRFLDCELIGAVVVMAGRTVIQDATFFNCDIVIARPDAFIQNVLVLEDCTIMGGQLLRSTIFFSQEAYERDIRPLGGNLVSYEKPAADAPSPVTAPQPPPDPPAAPQ
jgi:hypothetical protein